MIITKSVVILCLIVLAKAGTIKQRNIPVEIRYEEQSSEGNSVKNLDEKVQLPAEELKELVIEEIVEQKPEEDNSNSVEKGANFIRNLDEKVQLSQEELGQAAKHIPAQQEILNDNIAEEDVTSVKKLQLDGEQIPLNVPGILNEAQEIIVNSLKKLKVSFKPQNDQKAPNPTQWLDFEKTVNEFLEDEKRKIDIKQDQPDQNQNFFQNIASGFQTIANNFVQSFNQNGQNTTNQGDEQQGGGGGSQGPFLGFVSYFQGGVNNIVNSINNLGNQGPTTSNTVLGDTGTASTQAPGFIQGFVNNVQQFIGNIQGANNQGGGSSGTQSDTGVNSTASNQPQGPAVQVIQSIGSAVSQFLQGNRPPNTSGDEGSTPASTNVIQSIGQNIGNAIQNSPFNPFRPQAGQNGATSQNPIQAGVQNVGNQIQQIIPGNLTQKNPEDVPPKEQNTIDAERAPEPVETAQLVEADEPVEVAEPVEVVQPVEVAKPVEAEKQQEEVVKEEIAQEEEKKEVAEENKEVSEEKKEEILMASE